MNIALLLDELRQRDIQLRLEDGQLRCSAPSGTFDPELRETLRQRKPEIIEFLASAQILADHPAAIVPLQPKGKLPPVFAIAGHNGDVFCYRALSAALGDNQPFYGLQPPGLDGQGSILTSVEALADYFAGQIRAFHTTGPCIIAGYCAGGSIAFELARRLYQQDMLIRFVALFGSPFPAWYRFLPQSRRKLTQQKARIGVHVRALEALSWREFKVYLAEKWRQRQQRHEAEQRKGEEAWATARAAVEKATLAAVRGYQPGHFAGRICLFLPNTDWRYADDYLLTWSTGIAEQTEEYCGPDGCDGDSMLLPDNVASFAAAFQNCREEIAA